MDTPKQANKREAAIRKIIGALIGGRHLSLYDDAEFEVSEMHTCFCNVRQKSGMGKLPGTL